MGEVVRRTGGGEDLQQRTGNGEYSPTPIPIPD